MSTWLCRVSEREQGCDSIFVGGVGVGPGTVDEREGPAALRVAARTLPAGGYRQLVAMLLGINCHLDRSRRYHLEAGPSADRSLRVDQPGSPTWHEIE